MTINTYGTLKTAVADYLARSDLTSYIPDFIELARARIHHGSDHPQFPSEPLRIRLMETAADITISAQTAALPSGFLGAKRFYLNSTPISNLNQVSPTQLYVDFPSGTPGRPLEYTIEGGNFVFGPAPDQTYTGKLLYHQEYAAFSDDADTNTLLTASPGVYLYGALVEALPFVQEDARMPMWFAMFSAAIGGLQGTQKRDAWSGSIKVIRSDAGNP